MKLMCLNGWGGRMHDRLIRYLTALCPDVLCLQEVVHTPDAPKAELEYRDGDHILSQRARFFDEVAAALPDHTAIFCPAAQGVLWDGQVSVPSQWGLATFVHRALPIIGQRQGFVHKGYGPHGYGSHPRSRSAHAVRLYDYRADRPVTIAHTHGLRDLAGKHDTPERIAQAARLRDIAASVAEPGDPMIVCGDLNVGPDSQTFEILAELGLRDQIAAGGITSTRTAEYKKPMKFADYLLVNDQVAVRSFDVVRDPVVSDHCPLVLEFE